MRGDFLKKILSSFFGVIILLILTLVGVTYWEYLNQEKYYKNLSNLPVYQKIEDKNAVRILGEDDETAEGRLESEEYVVQDISFGGKSINIIENEDAEGPIEMSQLKGKIYFTDDGGINYYLSWQTSKPTISEVDYKNREEAEHKTIEENSHSYDHVVVFSDIDFSSVYEYTIESFDRWGVEEKFGEFVFYTTPPKSSFFELLEDSFQDAFGWTTGSKS